MPRMVKLFLFDMKIKVLLFFQQMEIGLLITKLKLSLMVALVATPFVEFMTHTAKRYYGIVIRDEDFILIWFYAILCDLGTGMWKHWKLHTFSFRDLMVKLAEKVGISAMGLTLFNSLAMLPKLVKVETFDLVSSSIALVGYLAVFAYVGGSAFNNFHIITNGKFPPIGFMRRMKNFNETMNSSELLDYNKNPDSDSITNDQKTPENS